MEYIDARGWRYRVMQGLDGSWKGRYRKPDKPWQKNRADDVGWKNVATLPWRKTQEEAERDLAEYAKRKEMRVYQKDAEDVT
ncbi:hypothetical protein [Selenomonas infelix]|nr:hypothetical protein [Selenomonas infelix]